jgi:hypothetical protein
MGTPWGFFQGLFNEIFWKSCTVLLYLENTIMDLIGSTDTAKAYITSDL